MAGDKDNKETIRRFCPDVISSNSPVLSVFSFQRNFLVEAMRAGLYLASIKTTASILHANTVTWVM